MPKPPAPSPDATTEELQLFLRQYWLSIAPTLSEAETTRLALKFPYSADELYEQDKAYLKEIFGAHPGHSLFCHYKYLIMAV